MLELSSEVLAVDTQAALRVADRYILEGIRVAYYHQTPWGVETEREYIEQPTTVEDDPPTYQGLLLFDAPERDVQLARVPAPAQERRKLHRKSRRRTPALTAKG